MKDAILWRSTDTNKYFFQELKKLFEAHDFVVSPQRTKRLVCIKDHYVQIVFPEVIHGITVIHMQVSPAVSFARYYYSDKKITLKKSLNEQPQNFYQTLEILKESKTYFDSTIIKATWNNVMKAQLESTIISYFQKSTFSNYVNLTKEGRDGVLSYCHSPGTEDALRYLAMGCNEIWGGHTQESLPFLKKAMAGYKQSLDQTHALGNEEVPGQREDLGTAIELAKILENNPCAIDQIQDKLRETEQKALELVWGIALNQDGKTIKLKRK